MNGSCEYCREFKDQARVLLCHLHAAAPALLSALERAMEYLGGWPADNQQRECREQARAAIALARGPQCTQEMFCRGNSHDSDCPANPTGRASRAAKGESA